MNVLLKNASRGFNFNFCAYIYGNLQRYTSLHFYIFIAEKTNEDATGKTEDSKNTWDNNWESKPSVSGENLHEKGVDLQSAEEKTEES